MEGFFPFVHRSSEAEERTLAEVLLQSPIGILSIITVVGALAVVIGWLVIWMYKIKHPDQ